MISSIVLGKSGARNIHLDILTLLRTRLLIQANSGGGKSFLLRRIAEQLYGKIPVHIIDPEGEFATLREKYGYVLIGEGGDAAADIRSAGLVAQRLLELRVPAVIDLYEAFRSKPQDRRTWVRKYLEALVDAPKSLWKPLVVIVDEAHKFVPQETPRAGNRVEQENIIGCKEAMIALSTVGRKRQFCAVWATQRLAKVDKDASAELLNRLIGPTFEDVDIDRAADMLSVSRDERQEFKKNLRVLEPGHFYAIGRAIAKEKVLIEIGPVMTTHPELGTSGMSATEIPPPPETIRRLLPKLADLPKEAEDKAKTVDELKTKIQQLERELKTRPTEPVAVLEKRVEIPFVPKYVLDAVSKMSGAFKTLDDALTRARTEEVTEAPRSSPPPIKVKWPTREQVKESVKTPVPAPINGNSNGDSTLTNPEQKILNAIAWMNSIGIDEPQQEPVGFLAGYSIKGNAYKNPRGHLSAMGLIAYGARGAIRLTDAGRMQASAPDFPLTPRELQDRVLDKLRGPEGRILKVLIDIYPETATNDELAAATNYSAKGNAYKNPRGRLSGFGLITYPEPGRVRAADLLFLK